MTAIETTAPNVLIPSGSDSPAQCPRAAAPPVPTCKVRLRFSKTGDLRFLSHHDLMRLMERLLRRAGLPFRSTEGFHPKPKIVFASALSLGVIGQQEVVEIEFSATLDPQAVLEKLTTLAPEGIAFFSAGTIPLRDNAQPIRALYHLPLPTGFRPDLQDRLGELLAQKHLLFDRIRHIPGRLAKPEPQGEERLDALTTAAPVPTKAQHKKIDLRPFIERLWRDDQGLWMDLAITNHGAVRPEELLRLVDLENYWLDGESILERVHLQLEDEPMGAAGSLSAGALSNGGLPARAVSFTAHPRSPSTTQAPAHSGQERNKSL